jgi:hypothetical protein
MQLEEKARNKWSVYMSFFVIELRRAMRNETRRDEGMFDGDAASMSKSDNGTKNRQNIDCDCQAIIHSPSIIFYCYGGASSRMHAGWMDGWIHTGYEKERKYWHPTLLVLTLAVGN